MNKIYLLIYLFATASVQQSLQDTQVRKLKAAGCRSPQGTKPVM